MDEAGAVDSIYFDFTKAFDTVPHAHLISKLHMYNISPIVIDWVKAFLTTRTQQVRVASNCSRPREVCSGVPQGSVLQPILFVLYINDLPDGLNSDCYMFADDTKLFREDTSATDCQLPQTDIGLMDKWSEAWYLHFNSNKCSVLPVGSRNIDRYHYNLGGSNYFY